MRDVSYVKLKFYEHGNQETIVNGFQAKDWGDFLLITLEAEQINPESYQQIANIFAEYSQKMDKEVILIPKGWDIQFYGVEVREDAGGAREDRSLDAQAH